MDELRKIDAEVIARERILAEGMFTRQQRSEIQAELKALKAEQKKLTAKAHREAAE